jgi:hypothetical protein
VQSMLAELRKRHAQRAGNDPLFQLYLGDIAHEKEQGAATSLSLVLDARRRTEQQEETWRAGDDQSWKKLTGGTPAESAGDAGPVASPQDVALREGAAIVADMHELAPPRHG